MKAPTSEELNEAIQATIQWCNEIRARKGLSPIIDLPLGVKADPYSCPCGKATNVLVGRLYFRFKSAADIQQPLPPLVTDFTRWFDQGWYPQYDYDRQTLQRIDEYPFR